MSSKLMILRYFRRKDFNFVSANNLSTFVPNVYPKPKNKLVRVRFAPSPTGYLHLGGLRTALYNYVFAKSHGGQFIIRIEDTDQTRLVKGAAQQLEEDLRWVGITPDESPYIEGSYGPYIQSERLHLYRGQAENLIESGVAYRCFCTERRLDLLRKESLRQRQVPRYDNRCRYLTQEEISKKLETNSPYCIRFKLTMLNHTIPDLVCGHIDYEPASHEGDPVILKMDGFPTYHLANVVDDHMMVITHVLRGIEWQISTPKHVLLYKAFGWEPPVYAHLPLIMNSDGTKLSKRQGDIQIQNYRKDGIFPNALLNYVTKAGGGFEANSLDEIYSLEELISKFDLNMIHKNSSRLTDRLEEYNQLELQKQLLQEKDTNILIHEVQQIVQDTFKDRLQEGSLQLQPEYIYEVLKWSQNRIFRLTDLVKPGLAFLWIVPSKNSLLECSISPELLTSLQKFLQTENAKDFTKAKLKTSLKQFSNKEDVPFKDLMKMLRSTLSGLKEGPGVAEMMEILGYENTISRLQNTITTLNLTK